MRTALLVSALMTGPAFAQDSADVDFRFGLGVADTPDYFGADTTSVGPTGSFSLERLTFGAIDIGGGDPYGIFPTGSFRLIGERSASENPELTGLDDVDLSVELGGGLRYAQPGGEAFAVVRYGVLGHEGWVAEVGGDLIYAPNGRTEMRVGPRLLAGDDTYADTYFGVPATAGGGFTPYAAEGGLVSRGVSASLSYDVTDDWGVTGTVRYDELIGDAGDSPIVSDTDQLSISVIVSRSFSFSF